jgi:uncharacterized protein involved in exopolysaccharide biosynthesis/Mrp family chromosome partitioning ATPase
MQKSPTNATNAGGFGVHDAIYVIFKHKWMIVGLTILGLLVAAWLRAQQVPKFKSESKLLIRYVLAKGALDPYETISAPGGGARGKGDPVINTEIEILYSMDLMQSVAQAVGVERLLPGAGPDAPPSAAAEKIRSSLEVLPGFSSSIVHVNYSNEDKQLTKDVLNTLLERYFKKHLEIHRSAAAFDLVAKQAEEAKGRLQDAEIALDRLRKESGIMSLSDATAALTAQKNKTQEDLLKARAELAEKLASLSEMENDSLAIEQEAARERASAKDKDNTPNMKTPPPGIISEYRSVVEMTGFLQKRDVELRIKFKPGNQLLVLNQRQLAANESRRIELERQYPALVSQAEISAADAASPRSRWITDKAALAAVQAKIDVLSAHLKEIGDQFSREYAVGARVEELQREKDMLDAEYRTLEAKLKNARVETTLDPSRMPNINIVQQPTEPAKSLDEKMQKIILGVAGSGLALGLALAFLIELVFNRKIERPVEIRARLQLPLMLTIPLIRRAGRPGMFLGGQQETQRIGMDDREEWPAEGADLPAQINPNARIEHFILPYSETIRDRIIFNFEVNNVIHKPKLVAVTSMSEGAGTSTIAAGLARSFSEIKGVKVLLVDLSSFHPQENPLFGEIPRHSLPNALKLAQENDFREQPQNLYYASATARRDDTSSLAPALPFTPLHLHEMMPLLHASDYDYIIFDMPPVDQTSRTLTMAGLMDKVLLVLDAENTTRDGLKWGYSELTKGKADVSCIFNKTRNHAPGWLIGEN